MAFPDSSGTINSPSAFAMAFMSFGGTKIPVLPLVIASEVPPTSVATIGLPAAIASIAVRGNPSVRDGINTLSDAARRFGRSLLIPKKVTR